MHEQQQDAEASGDGLRSIESDEHEPIATREGDVLVVSYPEVKIPLAKFTFATVGGLIYTRRLVTGDDIQNEYDRIYRFLERNAERSAREKVRKWAAELNTPQSLPAKAVAPKPLEPAGKTPSIPAMVVSRETEAAVASVTRRATAMAAVVTAATAPRGKQVPRKPSLAKRQGT